MSDQQQIPSITSYDAKWPPLPGSVEPPRRNPWKISTIVLGILLLVLAPCSCAVLFAAITDSGGTAGIPPLVSAGTRAPAEGYVGHPLNEPGARDTTAAAPSATAHLANDAWNTSDRPGSSTTMLAFAVSEDYPSWHVDSGTHAESEGTESWLLRLESPDHPGVYVDVRYVLSDDASDISASGWQRGKSVFGGPAGRAVGTRLLDEFASDYPAPRPVILSAEELARAADGTRSFAVAWRQPDLPSHVLKTTFVLAPTGVWEERK